MSPEMSSHEVPEQMEPDEPRDTEPLSMSSQIELLQPLQDSQGSSGVVSAQDTATRQPCQDIHTIPSMGVNRFTRPAIETAEEIGAGFQYQPPPGRNVPQKPGKKQEALVTSTQPPATISPEGGQGSGTLKFLDHGNRQKTPPSNHHAEEIGQPQANSPTAALLSPSHITGISQDAPDHDIPYVQKPTSNIPNPIHNENGPSLPFPDDNQDEIDLAHPGTRKSKASYSPLATAQFPKSISDVCRKALATLPPHNRSPQRKSSTSSSTSSDRQLAQTKKTSVKRTHLESQQHSAIPKPTSNALDVNKLVSDERPRKTERSSRKHHSGGRPKRKELTRPIPLDSPEYEPTSTIRPCSQASNISKPRAPPKTHQHQRTPTREQNSMNLIKFAKSWNTNYLYNQRLLDRWEQKLRSLEEHIAAQDSAIAQYQQEIEHRDQTIDDLSTKEEELRVQNQKVQDEITVSSNARKKLEEKLRACRNRLNDAIVEQQQLFLRCKENCERAIASIQTEGHAQRESVDNATATIESLRSEIKRKVAAVISDTNGQVDNLKNTIESLESQLIEREKELERERQHALDLNSQITDFRNLNEQSIQSVVTQNQELLEKMKLDREHGENRDILIRKQNESIDTILKILEETRLKAADPNALVENLEGLHNTTVERIVAGVKNSIDSHRDSILADQGTLNENLGEIHLLCTGIYEGMADANDVAGWQGRVHDADMVAHSYVQKIQELQDDVNQMHILSNQGLEEREKLKSQLAGLQNVAANEQAANEKAKLLEEEVKHLRGILNDRDATINKSSDDIEAVREELRAQARILQDKEEQIRSENERHQKAMELNVQQHKQETTRAVSTIAKECNEKLQAGEKRLQEAITVRMQLEHELGELRRERDISDQANIDEDLGQIRGELVEMVTSMTGLTIGLQESEHERGALQRSLEKWSRDRGEISQMRNLLGQLAKGQPNAIKMGEQLKELLEIQKRLSGTLEYHHTGLAKLGIAMGSGESQRNLETLIHPENHPDVTGDSRSDGVHTQELQNLKRKVVVKSPANDNEPTSLMSIEEERNTRRHLLPPRGIMKVTNQDTLREREVGGNVPVADSPRSIAQQPSTSRKVARRGSKGPLTTHSLYNRPVAGSVSGMNSGQGDENQHTHNGYAENDDMKQVESGDGDSGRLSEMNNVGEPPMKRQRTNGNQITQRVKLSHSMSGQLSTKVDSREPVEVISPGSRTLGGPIERRPTGLLTYGSQGLGTKRPRSQSSIISNSTSATSSQSSTTSSQTRKAHNQD
ncbi:hypothetical protein F5Y02DRAFT_271768 [Annulohypoxylon stygium]|nr:hypothetical protein F5Y02DRAFT_271768 [Annulohypoxylon stygium]